MVSMPNHLRKGGITPLWQRGARGDFQNNMSAPPCLAEPWIVEDQVCFTLWFVSFRELFPG
jgi:hypothetical protein